MQPRWKLGDVWTDERGQDWQLVEGWLGKRPAWLWRRLNSRTPSGNAGANPAAA